MCARCHGQRHLHFGKMTHNLWWNFAVRWPHWRFSNRKHGCMWARPHVPSHSIGIALNCRPGTLVRMVMLWIVNSIADPTWDHEATYANWCRRSPSSECSMSVTYIAYPQADGIIDLLTEVDTKVTCQCSKLCRVPFCSCQCSMSNAMRHTSALSARSVYATVAIIDRCLQWSRPSIILRKYGYETINCSSRSAIRNTFYEFVSLHCNSLSQTYDHELYY